MMLLLDLIVRLRGRRDALRRLVHGPGPARREIEADREKEVSRARDRNNIVYKRECCVGAVDAVRWIDR